MWENPSEHQSGQVIKVNITCASCNASVRRAQHNLCGVAAKNESESGPEETLEPYRMKGLREDSEKMRSKKHLKSASPPRGQLH